MFKATALRLNCQSQSVSQHHDCQSTATAINTIAITTIVIIAIGVYSILKLGAE